MQGPSAPVTQLAVANKNQSNTAPNQPNMSDLTADPKAVKEKPENIPKGSKNKHLVVVRYFIISLSIIFSRWIFIKYSSF